MNLFRFLLVYLFFAVFLNAALANAGFVQHFLRDQLEYALGDDDILAPAVFRIFPVLVVAVIGFPTQGADCLIHSSPSSYSFPLFYGISLHSSTTLFLYLCCSL